MEFGRGKRVKRVTVCCSGWQNCCSPGAHQPASGDKKFQGFASRNPTLETCTDSYDDNLAHQMANNAKLEKGGMQVMGKEDKGTMEACKALCSVGEWPPSLVTHDSRQGYVFALS
ncbi:unnamed protein product [Sphagnum compactum]